MEIFAALFLTTLKLYLFSLSLQLSERLNTCDDSGLLPLDLALETEKASNEMASTLIKHKADVNAKNAVGATPLHTAIERGDCAAALFLLAHGADPNATLPTSFDTPLHCAASSAECADMRRVVEELIVKGGNVNAQNADNL